MATIINGVTTAQEIKQEIAEKYQLDIDVFYDGDVLTIAEKDWLKNNPILTTAVPDDALPYSRLTKKGNIEGMIGDILAEMKKRQDGEFEVYQVCRINAMQA